MQQKKYDGTTDSIIGSLVLSVVFGANGYLAFQNFELSVFITLVSFFILGISFKVSDILEEIRDNLVELNKKENKQ